MSIRKIFEEELADLKTQLVEMCRLTEQMISDAITALVTRDRELGKSIGEKDRRVDEYEMEIEKKCMRILLKQQPVAKDFREDDILGYTDLSYLQEDKQQRRAAILEDPLFWHLGATDKAAPGKLNTLRRYFQAGGLSYVARAFMRKG